MMIIAIKKINKKKTIRKINVDAPTPLKVKENIGVRVAEFTYVTETWQRK